MASSTSISSHSTISLARDASNRSSFSFVLSHFTNFFDIIFLFVLIAAFLLFMLVKFEENSSSGLKMDNSLSGHIFSLRNNPNEYKGFNISRLAVDCLLFAFLVFFVAVEEVSKPVWFNTFRFAHLKKKEGTYSNENANKSSSSSANSSQKFTTLLHITTCLRVFVSSFLIPFSVILFSSHELSCFTSTPNLLYSSSSSSSSSSGTDTFPQCSLLVCICGCFLFMHTIRLSMQFPMSYTPLLTYLLSSLFWHIKHNSLFHSDSSLASSFLSDFPSQFTSFIFFHFFFHFALSRLFSLGKHLYYLLFSFFTPLSLNSLAPPLFDRWMYSCSGRIALFFLFVCLFIPISLVSLCIAVLFDTTVVQPFGCPFVFLPAPLVPKLWLVAGNGCKMKKINEKKTKEKEERRKEKEKRKKRYKELREKAKMQKKMESQNVPYDQIACDASSASKGSSSLFTPLSVPLPDNPQASPLQIQQRKKSNYSSSPLNSFNFSELNISLEELSSFESHISILNNILDHDNSYINTQSLKIAQSSSVLSSSLHKAHPQSQSSPMSLSGTEPLYPSDSSVYSYSAPSILNAMIDSFTASSSSVFNNTLNSSSSSSLSSSAASSPASFPSFIPFLTPFTAFMLHSTSSMNILFCVGEVGRNYCEVKLKAMDSSYSAKHLEQLSEDMEGVDEVSGICLQSRWHELTRLKMENEERAARIKLYSQHAEELKQKKINEEMQKKKEEEVLKQMNSIEEKQKKLLGGSKQEDAEKNENTKKLSNASSTHSSASSSSTRHFPSSVSAPILARLSDSTGNTAQKPSHSSSLSISHTAAELKDLPNAKKNKGKDGLHEVSEEEEEEEEEEDTEEQKTDADKSQSEDEIHQEDKNSETRSKSPEEHSPEGYQQSLLEGTTNEKKSETEESESSEVQSDSRNPDNVVESKENANDNHETANVQNNCEDTATDSQEAGSLTEKKEKNEQEKEKEESSQKNSSNDEIKAQAANDSLKEKKGSPVEDQTDHTAKKEASADPSENLLLRYKKHVEDTPTSFFTVLRNPRPTMCISPLTSIAVDSYNTIPINFTELFNNTQTARLVRIYFMFALIWEFLMSSPLLLVGNEEEEEEEEDEDEESEEEDDVYIMGRKGKRINEKRNNITNTEKVQSKRDQTISENSNGSSSQNETSLRSAPFLDPEEDKSDSLSKEKAAVSANDEGLSIAKEESEEKDLYLKRELLENEATGGKRYSSKADSDSDEDDDDDSTSDDSDTTSDSSSTSDTNNEDEKDLSKNIVTTEVNITTPQGAHRQYPEATLKQAGDGGSTPCLTNSPVVLTSPSGFSSDLITPTHPPSHGSVIVASASASPTSQTVQNGSFLAASPFNEPFTPQMNHAVTSGGSMLDSPAEGSNIQSRRRNVISPLPELSEADSEQQMEEVQTNGMKAGNCKSGFNDKVSLRSSLSHSTTHQSQISNEILLPIVHERSNNKRSQSRRRRKLISETESNQKHSKEFLSTSTLILLTEECIEMINNSSPENPSATETTSNTGFIPTSATQFASFTKTHAAFAMLCAEYFAITDQKNRGVYETEILNGQQRNFHSFRDKNNCKDSSEQMLASTSTNIHSTPNGNAPLLGSRPTTAVSGLSTLFPPPPGTAQAMMMDQSLTDADAFLMSENAKRRGLHLFNKNWKGVDNSCESCNETTPVQGNEFELAAQKEKERKKKNLLRKRMIEYLNKLEEDHFFLMNDPEVVDKQASTDAPKGLMFQPLAEEVNNHEPLAEASHPSNCISTSKLRIEMPPGSGIASPSDQLSQPNSATGEHFSESPSFAASDQQLRRAMQLAASSSTPSSSASSSSSHRQENRDQPFIGTTATPPHTAGMQSFYPSSCLNHAAHLQYHTGNAQNIVQRELNSPKFAPFGLDEQSPFSCYRQSNIDCNPHSLISPTQMHLLQQLVMTGFCLMESVLSSDNNLEDLLMDSFVEQRKKSNEDAKTASASASTSSNSSNAGLLSTLLSQKALYGKCGAESLMFCPVCLRCYHHPQSDRGKRCVCNLMEMNQSELLNKQYNNHSEDSASNETQESEENELIDEKQLKQVEESFLKRIGGKGSVGLRDSIVLTEMGNEDFSTNMTKSPSVARVLEEGRSGYDSAVDADSALVLQQRHRMLYSHAVKPADVIIVERQKRKEPATPSCAHTYFSSTFSSPSSPVPSSPSFVKGFIPHSSGHSRTLSSSSTTGELTPLGSSSVAKFLPSCYSQSILSKPYSSSSSASAPASPAFSASPIPTPSYYTYTTRAIPPMIHFPINYAKHIAAVFCGRLPATPLSAALTTAIVAEQRKKSYSPTARKISHSSSKRKSSNMKIDIDREDMSDRSSENSDDDLDSSRVPFSTKAVRTTPLLHSASSSNQRFLQTKVEKNARSISMLHANSSLLQTFLSIVQSAYRKAVFVAVHDLQTKKYLTFPLCSNEMFNEDASETEGEENNFEGEDEGNETKIQEAHSNNEEAKNDNQISQDQKEDSSTNAKACSSSDETSEIANSDENVGNSAVSATNACEKANKSGIDKKSANASLNNFKEITNLENDSATKNRSSTASLNSKAPLIASAQNNSSLSSLSASQNKLSSITQFPLPKSSDKSQSQPQSQNQLQVPTETNQLFFSLQLQHSHQLFHLMRSFSLFLTFPPPLSSADLLTLPFSPPLIPLRAPPFTEHSSVLPENSMKWLSNSMCVAAVVGSPEWRYATEHRCSNIFGVVEATFERQLCHNSHNPVSGSAQTLTSFSRHKKGYSVSFISPPIISTEHQSSSTSSSLQLSEASLDNASEIKGLMCQRSCKDWAVSEVAPLVPLESFSMSQMQMMMFAEGLHFKDGDDYQNVVSNSFLNRSRCLSTNKDMMRANCGRGSLLFIDSMHPQLLRSLTKHLMSFPISEIPMESEAAVVKL
ncbi:uncharacterized protein MONOS_174 [Monocercomonoides exilis]|uniref:uncharacterized protein n=1 Tax=Monocercomonoides exilis TaxID=2049356 RepID=UPI00355A0DD7|nr:hypothetical protein MONOS_174 [Monocercomonoides exilis]|eukprot:MONOS_174.1-p1 / transcript=MONOS_174.1 / gene=MONOS_174 / organism=Monocercomonoides_exilis_PA203 / gene_product=unspecified product / transcript_product=unspecified product / location=Mono_scaffold00003:113638-122334(+) / protein_length=2899 / sequence_SO=supercontig / SO=protein_coding / is_pseudo=false